MDFLDGLPFDKRQCIDSVDTRHENSNPDNFSSSTNTQFNMYTQLIGHRNGHRKAITKHRIEQKVIQSKTQPRNSANNCSKNALTVVASRSSEKGTINRITVEKNGRENRLLKTTTTSVTNSKNMNSITRAKQLSRILEQIFTPEATSQEKIIIPISNRIHHSPNSLLILRNGYLWVTQATAAINQVIGKKKKRKKPGGARNNNGSMFKFREVFGLMVCYLGQTANAWNDHYGEEDDTWVLKIVLPIFACVILLCMGGCYYQHHLRQQAELAGESKDDTCGGDVGLHRPTTISNTTGASLPAGATAAQTNYAFQNPGGFRGAPGVVGGPGGFAGGGPGGGGGGPGPPGNIYSNHVPNAGRSFRLPNNMNPTDPNNQNNPNNPNNVYALPRSNSQKLSTGAFTPQRQRIFQNQQNHPQNPQNFQNLSNSGSQPNVYQPLSLPNTYQQNPISSFNPARTQNPNAQNPHGQIHANAQNLAQQSSFDTSRNSNTPEIYEANSNQSSSNYSDTGMLSQHSAPTRMLSLPFPNNQGGNHGQNNGPRQRKLPMRSASMYDPHRTNHNFNKNSVMPMTPQSLRLSMHGQNHHAAQNGHQNPQNPQFTNQNSHNPQVNTNFNPQSNFRPSRVASFNNSTDFRQIVQNQVSGMSYPKANSINSYEFWNPDRQNGVNHNPQNAQNNQNNQNNHQNLQNNPPSGFNLSQNPHSNFKTQSFRRHSGHERAMFADRRGGGAGKNVNFGLDSGVSCAPSNTSGEDSNSDRSSSPKNLQLSLFNNKLRQNLQRREMTNSRIRTNSTGYSGG